MVRTKNYGPQSLSSQLKLRVTQLGIWILDVQKMYHRPQLQHAPDKRLPLLVCANLSFGLECSIT